MANVTKGVRNEDTEEWDWASVRPSDRDRLVDTQTRITLTGESQDINFTLQRPTSLQLISIYFDSEDEKSFTIDMYGHRKNTATRIASYSNIYDQYITIPLGDEYFFMYPRKLVFTFTKSHKNGIVDISLKLKLL